jgi:hypothetical protein
MHAVLLLNSRSVYKCRKKESLKRPDALPLKQAALIGVAVVVIVQPGFTGVAVLSGSAGNQSSRLWS